MKLRYICVTILLAVLTAGCSTRHRSDPKTRYSKAHQHASRVLREAGSDLRPYSDGGYDLMVFRRKYYDKVKQVLHVYELYDFVKVADRPGPDHFVIVYDDITGTTYLRSDLRSEKNLERLLAE